MKEAQPLEASGEYLLPLLDALLAPVGLCDLSNNALIWSNPALKRLLVEHNLAENVSI